MNYKLFYSVLIALLLLPLSSIAQIGVWNQEVTVDYPTGLQFDADDSMFFIVQGDGLFEKEGSLINDLSTGLITTNVVSLEMNGTNLWIGGYGGLTHFDGIIYTTYTLPGSNAIYDVDVEGSAIWTVMENEGAGYFDGTTWTYYALADGILGDWHTCIEKDGGSNVFLGSTDFSSSGEGVVNFFDGTTWTSQSSADGITLTDLRAIFYDSNGNLWIGGDAIMYYDGSIWNNVSAPISGYIQSINEDGDGNIWFAEVGGTLLNKVFMYDGTSVQDMNAPSSFGGRPEGIEINSAGVPYFCLQDGIYSFDDTTTAKIETYNESSSFLIYPNPTASNIVLNFGQVMDLAIIKLYSIEGKEIMTKSIYNESTIELELETIPAGIYFVQLNDGIKKRFVKY